MTMRALWRLWEHITRPSVPWQVILGLALVESSSSRHKWTEDFRFGYTSEFAPTPPS